MEMIKPVVGCTLMLALLNLTSCANPLTTAVYLASGSSVVTYYFTEKYPEASVPISCFFPKSLFTTKLNSERYLRS